jgi:chromosome partitioning protein
MVISLVNQKGGVGKTTVAIHLADGLSAEGRRVQLIDTDPQGSVVQWASISEKSRFAVRHHPSPLQRKKLRAALKQFDDLVIDSPPAMGSITRANLSVSELAIIPIGPSPLDIWSGKETAALVEGSRKRRRGLICRLLICRKVSRTRIGREARDALETYGLKIFNTEICQRIAYVEAVTSGSSVLQYAPSSIASREVRRLCREVVAASG